VFILYPQAFLVSHDIEIDLDKNKQLYQFSSTTDMSFP